MPTDPPELIDHIGWDLWTASDAWSSAFTARMVAAGHPWFAEARAALIPHIGRTGTDQALLSQRAGLTKQAVQQHLDDLTRDGIVHRQRDPRDARRKRVLLTQDGLNMLTLANSVKREIEAEYAEALGQDRFQHLLALLAELRAVQARHL